MSICSGDSAPRFVIITIIRDPQGKRTTPQGPVESQVTGLTDLTATILNAIEPADVPATFLHSRSTVWVFASGETQSCERIRDSIEFLSSAAMVEFLRHQESRIFPYDTPEGAFVRAVLQKYFAFHMQNLQKRFCASFAAGHGLRYIAILFTTYSYF